MYHDLRQPAALAHKGPEDALQRDCAAFLKKALHARGLPQQLFFHVPSEGIRKPQYRAKLKIMGFRAGIPDVILLLPSGQFHGLLVELKRAGGTPSKDQKEFLTEVGKLGYLCVVVNDLSTFQKTIESYLNL